MLHNPSFLSTLGHMTVQLLLEAPRHLSLHLSKGGSEVHTVLIVHRAEAGNEGGLWSRL